MTRAKKTTTRRKPAKRAPAKPRTNKAPAQKPETSIAKSAPVAEQSCPIFADAIMHITGLPTADIEFDELVKQAKIWGDLKCDALPKGVGLAVLFGYQLHGPLITRMLRKSLGMEHAGSMSDAVIAKAHEADRDWLILNLASFIIRRAAFMPSAHAKLAEIARGAIRVCLHTMEVQEQAAETGETPEGAEVSKPDENPAEMAAGVLHEPGTDGVPEQEAARSITPSTPAEIEAEDNADAKDGE